jgi:hypothetical protein
VRPSPIVIYAWSANARPAFLENHMLIGKIRLYFIGSGLIFPVINLDGVAAYFSSSGPLPDPPEGYPVLWLTAHKQYDATLELNAEKNMIYPGDTVIVLLPVE